MKLRITMTGEVDGTRVYDAETGKPLDAFIQAVTIVHRAGELPVVTLSAVDVEVDAVAELAKKP